MDFRRFAFTAVVSVVWAAGASAAPAPPARARAFIQEHCADCHDADSHKGGLDLTSLSFDLNSSKTFDLWVKVHDRVRDGELPPK
jgi:mono/diheme cytochrome c family protein